MQRQESNRADAIILRLLWLRLQKRRGALRLR